MELNQGIVSPLPIITLWIFTIILQRFSLPVLVSAQESYSLDFKVRGLVEGDANAVSIKDSVSGQIISSITANGEYTFPNPITDGDRFKLVVTNQPNQPNQTCSIERGSGKMSKWIFKIMDIVVTCRTPIEHVVIIGIDGMGGAYVREEEASSLNVRTPSLPTLRSLQAESAWTYLAQDALPSSSSTNWVSMLGGNSPDVHGVLSNSWERGDSVIPPTLFAITRDAYPTSQIGLLYDWGGLGRLIEDDVADVKYSPGNAAETVDAANLFIADNQPILTFMHLDLCDHAGHVYGWGSEAYVEALESADSLIASVINNLKNQGLWGNTALLISSDHGGEGYGHGDDTYLERTIPFIVKTPQSVGFKITREVRVWDIAATAAALLDLDHPNDWVSIPAYEAIPFSPEWESMATSNNFYKEVNEFELVYDTIDTGMNNQLSIMRPVVPPGYVSLGDLAFPNANGTSKKCISDETTCSCTSDDTDYRGTIARTVSGRTCQKWTDQSPHTHIRTPGIYPNAGLGDHNYCRNPDEEPGAWCYTTDADKRWELCDIPECPTIDTTTFVVLRDHPSVSHPISYELIWSSEGTTDEKVLTLWNPIPEPGGYSCPGQIAKTDYDGPPSLTDVACIQENYLNFSSVSVSSKVWNDSGSGADMDGSIWQCEGVGKTILDPNLFISRRVSNNDPGNNDCRVLKKWMFSQCQDDQTFRFRNRELRDCKWVAAKINQRCNKKWRKKKVYQYCPVTCSKC